MPKIYKVDQGTPEWWELRLGIPTASQFHRIITPAKLEYSKQAVGYQMELLAERLLHQPMGSDFLDEWAERGKLEQNYARQQFQLVNEVELDPIGFVTNDNGSLGCSPDALFKGGSQAVEIKTPKPPKLLEYAFTTDWQVNYRPQVQGQLMIGEFEVVHLYVFHQQLKAHHVITSSDRQFQIRLVSYLAKFCEELAHLEQRARKLGIVVTPPPAPGLQARMIVPDAPHRDAHQTILDAG